MSQSSFSILGPMRAHLLLFDPQGRVWADDLLSLGVRDWLQSVKWTQDGCLSKDWGLSKIPEVY